MNSLLDIRLNANAEQSAQLVRLQTEFAAACNSVAPIAQQHRCWNRVALHHLSYRILRDQFPQLGSQMACNVIYSVARTYRTLLTLPQSPWNVALRGGAPLPSLRFANSVPVYFDRHTLSVKGNVLSMFTLDGRLRFEITVSDTDAARLADGRLREIVLRNVQGAFALQFLFSDANRPEGAAVDSDLPEYVLVTETPSAPVQPVAA